MSALGVERLKIQSDGLNRFNGRLGLNTNPNTDTLLSFSGACTSGVLCVATQKSGSGCNVFYSYVTAVGTGSVTHFLAQTTAGAGTPSQVVGFDAFNTIATGATNYGFRSTIDSDAGKNNYAFYASGTAPNYVAGQVQTALGTAAAPSIAFNSDPDTGTWSPGSNSWAVSCGGVERLQLESGFVWLGGKSGLSAGGTENVLTGTTTGDGKSLLIASGQPATTANAGSSISLATVEGSGVSRARQTRLYIAPDGKVGVGNVSPQRQLDVSGSVYAVTFDATVGSAATPAFSFVNDPNTGMYQDTADTFCLATGGVERMRVKATGGVKYVPLATAPATPDEGEVYFDSTTKKLRVYDGTAWADLH